ncbi:sensor histidine kinase [Streptomyces sp. NPDC002851]
MRIPSPLRHLPRPRRLLRPLTRAVTYTRWLHLWIAIVIIGLWQFVFPGLRMLWVPVLLVAAAGLVPWVRLSEGTQARFLLFPSGRSEVRDQSGEAIAAAPSASWSDRGRTVVWLLARLGLGSSVALLSAQLPMLTVDLVAQAAGGRPDAATFVALPGHHWSYALLAPLPLVVLAAAVVLGGKLITVLAVRLLGPSPAERMAALEERTEQLLERTRIARELHDSIGHALTVAVVQAGAARAAGDAEFTDRALGAIEETGRTALEDLERVLRVLREDRPPASGRPTLADAERLLDSARSSGAKVDAEVTGPVERLPGPVTREGYRILQESLTNVLRHAAGAEVRVRIAVTDRCLELELTNPLAGAPQRGGGGGSGLRGIRERVALLGGTARTGACDGQWRVWAELPLPEHRRA